MELSNRAGGCSSRAKAARRGRSKGAALAAALVPVGAVLGVALAGRPSPLSAHDIPATVVVRLFVKPEGERLRVLVRVPLESMRDIPWPVRGPGYLDLERAGPLLREAARTWIANDLEIYEGDRRLRGEQIAAVTVSLPSDRSFGDYQSALTRVAGPPLPAGTELVWQQALLDVLLEYPIVSEGARFAIRPALAHLGLKTTTILRFLPPGGQERVFEYVGDPGLVRLDPRWHQAAIRFVELGFAHILGGTDHLLFVLCLAIPFRRLRPLVAIVTAFTVAHSITLIASAMGFAPGGLWFPPLVELLIALSIVYTAIENIIGAKLERRWLVAFGFGLVHGFGFAFVLRESLQFAGSHLRLALVSFNLGVELGQLFLLALGIPILNLLFRYVVAAPVGIVILSVLVAHTAWHWMTERWAALRQYAFRWPAWDLALVVGLMRALMLGLVLAGALWLLRGLVRRLLPRARAEPHPAEGRPPT